MSPPPLNALRVFEIAARSGSFTQAGADLGVTAAAVSLQIKALEAHLGRQLFLRQGNRLTLTDAGRALYPRIAAALTDITAATEALTEGPGRGRVTVSCLPSLAELWLVPRLAALDLQARLNLRIEEDPAPLSEAGIDIRLTYGGQDYPDLIRHKLFRASIIAVTAPGRFADFPNLPPARFLHTDWGRSFASHPDWAVWAHAAGCGAPDPAQGLRLSHTAAAVAAARAGLGVALVPEPLAADDLAAGRLQRLAGPELPMAWDYVAITTAASERRKPVAALLAALIA